MRTHLEKIEKLDPGRGVLDFSVGIASYKRSLQVIQMCLTHCVLPNAQPTLRKMINNFLVFDSLASMIWYAPFVS